MSLIVQEEFVDEDDYDADRSLDSFDIKNNKNRSFKSWDRHKRRCFVAVVLLLLVVAIAIGFGTGFSKRQDKTVDTIPFYSNEADEFVEGNNDEGGNGNQQDNNDQVDNSADPVGEEDVASSDFNMGGN
jgi:hypothetical protein